MKKKPYNILYLDPKKAVVETTIRGLKTRKSVYRYIPVLNPLPWKPGTRVRVVIQVIE